MKVFINTIGEINARTPILNQDLTTYMKAVTGKTTDIEIAPTATPAELIAAARTKLGLDAVTITKTVLLNGKKVVTAASLGAAGIAEGSALTIKCVLVH